MLGGGGGGEGLDGRGRWETGTSGGKRGKKRHAQLLLNRDGPCLVDRGNLHASASSSSKDHTWGRSELAWFLGTLPSAEKQVQKVTGDPDFSHDTDCFVFLLCFGLYLLILVRSFIVRC